MTLATGGKLYVGSWGSGLWIGTPGGEPTPTYALTVVGGSGSGSYAAGTAVPIAASTPPAGKIFDKWDLTTGNGSFANATSASTTYTMPAGVATVTALYKDAPVTGYTLTVVNGTGSGNFPTWTATPISANAPPAGKVFDRWTVTSGSGSFADPYSANTNFNVYNAAATVTALYKDAPATILWTDYESNFWNWIMFAVLFGWIWMWFI